MDVTLQLRFWWRILVDCQWALGSRLERKLDYCCSPMRLTRDGGPFVGPSRGSRLSWVNRCPNQGTIDRRNSITTGNLMSGNADVCSQRNSVWGSCSAWLVLGEDRTWNRSRCCAVGVSDDYSKNRARIGHGIDRGAAWFDVEKSEERLAKCLRVGIFVCCSFEHSTNWIFKLAVGAGEKDDHGTVFLKLKQLKNDEIGI